MIEVEKDRRCLLAPLFSGWEETLIWSCLQGRMGKAWADSLDSPTAALVMVGDFFFLAGDAASPAAKALAGYIPADFPSKEGLLAPQNQAWAQIIEEVYGQRASQAIRYAIKKEPHVFDREKLTAFRKALPEGFTLRPIDQELYSLAQKESWSQDLVSQFPTAQDYEKDGLGVAALCGDRLAAGASSYTVYNGGIEIEIDTKQEYRRQGLALACGAALILRCLGRGLYPSWDAANLASVALAEKLGYHLDHEYPIYVVRNA